jgi:ATP-dependent DNA helicase RecQ
MAPFARTSPAPSHADHRHAQLVLQGIADVAAAPSPTRLYRGPAEPEPLLAHLGYERFRPGQREAASAALAGRDSLVVMPTGGGKSLCYQLPGLASPKLTIVVSPLIALMADQSLRLAGGGHPVAMLASGLPEEASRAALAAVAGGAARIVYCSPERFASAAFWSALERRDVDLFAIDEAHCLAEWGHDFRPDYLRLPRAIERLGRPPVMALTATATEAVAAEIVRRLGLREPLSVRSGFDRPSISFDIVRFEGEGSRRRKLAVLERGLADRDNRPAIVYCGTRRDTEEVAAELAANGLAAIGYHAGMEPDERAAAQQRFMAGDGDVVVATNAFGMGIDKADVRSVWHWAIPTSVEAYYQEAGRAGRDGAPARAVLLAGRSDLGRLVHFNEQRAVEPAAIAAYHRALCRAADGAPSITIEAPRDERDRIRLAIAERAGAVSVDPAPGGRLLVGLGGELRPRLVARECRIAADRGWRAFRAVRDFAFSDRCRRRALLDHFGDPAPGKPSGRCCDMCDPPSWLPDPQAISVGAASRRRQAAAPAPAELAGPDLALFEELRRWRREAAAGNPAFTVAHDSTLRAIAASRPRTRTELATIRGIGPSFLARHGEELLAVLSDHVS